MNKFLIILIVLLISGIVAFSISLNSNSDITKNTISEKSSTDKVKTFLITGENFKFLIGNVNNPDIVVNEGDIVRIEFTSTKGFHDWVVDEFGATTAKVRETDSSTFVEFIADKKGTFEYYCSVGQHRANGMKGKLIVE